MSLQSLDSGYSLIKLENNSEGEQLPSQSSINQLNESIDDNEHVATRTASTEVADARVQSPPVPALGSESTTRVLCRSSTRTATALETRRDDEQANAEQDDDEEAPSLVFMLLCVPTYPFHYCCLSLPRIMFSTNTYSCSFSILIYTA